MLREHSHHRQTLQAQTKNETKIAEEEKKQTQNVNEKDDKNAEKGWPSQGMHVKIF